MFLEGESLSINKGYLIKYILKKKSYREIIMLQPTNFRKVCEDQFCTKRFLFQMLTETKKKILHINFSNILLLVIVSDSKTKSCQTKLHHCLSCPMNNTYFKTWNIGTGFLHNITQQIPLHKFTKIYNPLQKKDLLAINFSNFFQDWHLSNLSEFLEYTFGKIILRTMIKSPCLLHACSV